MVDGVRSDLYPGFEPVWQVGLPAKNDLEEMGITETRIKRQTIQCDDGPEFASKALDLWA